MNTKSSTEPELVGTDYTPILILWTNIFLNAQGYKSEQNVLYQENKSTILLQENINLFY